MKTNLLLGTMSLDCIQIHLQGFDSSTLLSFVRPKLAIFNIPYLGVQNIWPVLATLDVQATPYFRQLHAFTFRFDQARAFLGAGCRQIDGVNTRG
jgi:hypothetical protein